MQASRLSFGPFVLDPEAGLLFRDGQPLAIGHRALTLLSTLAARPGQVLAKSELLDAAWPGLFVAEANLTVQIAQIRKLLGPAPGGGGWIATIPRVGYRFCDAADLRADAPRGPVASGKASVAILPFVAIGGGPAQASFADGLTEDLITELSRMPGLFVIARNSVFSCRERLSDTRAIAEALGVRYLVEGSAQRDGGRVRVNVRLGDGASGEQLWAERFDRTLDDVFAIQDEVTARIAAVLSGRLARAPESRRRPENLEAYDLCVRARRLMDDEPRAAREAHLLLSRAIALDPTYAEAHRWLALNHWMGRVHAGGPDAADRAAALVLARRAVELDPGDAGCRWVLAYLFAYARRFADAEAEFARAVAIDPNEADAFAAMSDIAVLGGRIDEGLENAHRAMRLNPFPPGWYHLVLGQAQYAAGDCESAVATLRRDETYRSSSRRFLAASLARLGRLDEARAEAELFLAANPDFSISHWAAAEPFRDRGVLARFIADFRAAGLPD